MEKATLASFGRRLLATILDTLIIMLPPIINLILAEQRLQNTYMYDYSAGFGESPYTPMYHSSIVATIIFVVITIALIVLNIRWICQGQSIGKKILNLRVVDVRTGETLQPGRMMMREYLCKPISGTFLFAGYFRALRDPKIQTWHDQMMNTVVIFCKADSKAHSQRVIQEKGDVDDKGGNKNIL